MFDCMTASGWDLRNAYVPEQATLSESDVLFSNVWEGGPAQKVSIFRVSKIILKGGMKILSESWVRLLNPVLRNL